MAQEPLLDHIDSPRSLRRLSSEQLQQLAGEVRRRIEQVVSGRGGHLASNLGVTELTIALHYVFDFARDRLVFDVGHQCYPHKLLTGRAGRFDTLRQGGGLSGYPAPVESPYDPFATGHAGAAISTAAGLAWADGAATSRVVAVVGDASIVNGLALEGINNAAVLRRQFLIVLNDNSMAIDRTRGGLAGVLDRIRMTETYDELKHSTERFLQHVPFGGEVYDALRHLRDGLRSSVHGGQIFESFGLRYFGPVDGHDIDALVAVLSRVANMKRPVLLHVHTQKGHGVDYAVEDPTTFHSPSAFELRDGRAVFAGKTRPTWSQTFADALCARADADERIVAITAAMPDGTRLTRFRDRHEDRCIDVGISEAHAVALAGGLARAGKLPVVALYATFAQRAVDQVFHDVALQDQHVVFCLDRAGLVGADGASHHGFMDIATLRAIPRVTLLAPGDAAEMSAAMDFALAADGPVAIRYPRGDVPADLPGDCPPFELGRARTVRDGADGTFLAYGAMVAPAMEAAGLLAERGRDVGVVNARFAKPVDASCVARCLAGGPVLVCEDHARTGGFGSAVLEAAAERGLDASRLRLLGLPDRFVAHAARGEQLADVGLDASSLAEAMAAMVSSAAAPHQSGSR
ncbi:MAG: 1-deoxy-D-xylulose-5-phosphate synthase [Phycisphaerae bacterium]|nr:1-deoxy-D-xylulose-5-phosphate synthase [Phycisphaerae bacterium]